MKLNDLFLFLLLLILSSCQPESEEADLIITNATIWTGAEEQPYAQAMAIANGRILYVGKEARAAVFKDDKTEVIDLQGRFVTPGFIDSHVHLMTGGRSLLSVDLKNAATPEEFSQLVGDFAKTLEPGEWILEGNWDHTLWGGELPRKEWIDSLTPDNPVLIMRLDWHMALANTATLKSIGIDKNTPDVEGGYIERDKDGNPTGLLKDNAMNLVLDNMPPMTMEQKDKSFRSAMDYFFIQWSYFRPRCRWF